MHLLRRFNGIYGICCAQSIAAALLCPFAAYTQALPDKHITLDLENRPLKAVLSEIMQAAGADFVVDKSLDAAVVSIYLKDVSLPVALKTVLKSSSLPVTYRVEANVYHFVSGADDPSAPAQRPRLRAPILRINPRDAAAMLYISEGFYIYRSLVTTAQYRKFCTATAHAMPPEPAGGRQEDSPVVNVTRDDATAYARWAGVQLATDAQWARAEAEHIGLIPSLFWNAQSMSDLVGEPMLSLTDPNSKTMAFIRQYTADIVSRYGRDHCPR